MPRLLATIFDMDGVLLDSEPFWQDAEMEVFGSLGLPLSREQCRQTMGMRIDQVVRLRYAEQPWPAPRLDAVAEAVVDRVVELVRRDARTLPGVHEALGLLSGRGLRLALASSSSYRLIDAVLEALGLDDAFEVLHSAEEEGAGKPDPAVYLTAAAKLGVPPSACLAIEDSPAGVEAAKAATMACVAVPDPWAAAPQFDRADLVLASLADLDGAAYDDLAARWA